MNNKKRGNKKNKMMNPKKESLRISLIYLFFGFLWITLSDKILQVLVSDFQTYSQLQIYKGWFYVGITTLLIFFLVYKKSLAIEESFKKLQTAAYTDPLTKLPNKSAFLKMMEEHIEEEKPFYLAYIDLDNFRFINDTLGHRAGDDFLRYISQGLMDIKKENEFSARLGGDEFGFLVPGNIGREAFEERLEEVVKSFGKFWQQRSHHYFISFSIGVAKYPEDGITSFELYKNANIALNKGKKSGKNTLVFFEEILQKDVTENVKMATELQEAIEQDRLNLHYQPYFNLHNMEINSIEALIRWKKPSGSFVPPDLFIPVAEETGQILIIDRWVLRQVFLMKEELEKKDINWKIAMNLSSKTLMSEVNFPHFLALFNEFDIDFSGIVVEITETAVIGDIFLAIARLKELKKTGVRIALDDFGTGYSSLNHLKNLPIDIVKLDRSFVGSISGDNREGKIIKSIISLSQELGFEVVAEGIETKEQLEYLQENGCVLGQGFYLQRPAAIEKIIK